MKHLMTALAALLLSLPAAAQQAIDLSGRWSLSLGRAGAAPDWINLPASMPEKLKGDPVTAKTRWTGSLYDSSYYYNPYMERYRREGNIKLPFFLTPDRHYVGTATYSRTVAIPKAWRGQRITLFLERPHIETTVSVDGRTVGSQNSLSVPHEYDLTPYVRSGSIRLDITVDNRIKDINPGPDSHSITDQTQGNWNGITGRIELRATPKTYIDDCQIFPDIKAKTALVRLTVAGSGRAELTIQAESLGEGPRQLTSAVSRKLDIASGKAQVELTLPMGDSVRLWDEFSPNLYRLTATVASKRGTDRRQTDFGMRQFETRGRMFAVNGRTTMLRGTVENCDFPLTGYPPADRESWERLLLKCRQYGLNHIRFHSYCPPEAAFEAADRIGFYLQPEGPSWPNHGPKLGLGQPIDDYLMAETQRMVRRYGNHPSFCMLAAGNEPSGRWVDWVSRFTDYWQKADPRRVYTGASVGNGWQWQPKNQYHVKAGARGLTWAKQRPATDDDFRYQSRLDTVRQPYVAHEMGQWCAFPDFDEIGLYTGVNKARNFEIFRDLLTENDMADRAHLFMMASGKLQALCYKYEIEKLLRTPDYAGFQLLSLNDYSGQGTALVGVLNVFFKEKGYIDAPQWRRFCSETVPLMRTSRFVYNSTDTLRAAIEIAHFGPKPLPHPAAHYYIKDADGRPVSDGTLTPPVNHDSTQPECAVCLPLNRFAKPVKLNLEVRVDGTDAANDWDFWVYPTADSRADTGDILIADSLSAEAIERLSHGGKVLITAAGKISYGRDIVQQFLPVFWNTSWFKMRPPHTTGILVNPNHPLFREFPTEYHSNLQWWELLNRAQVMQFDRFPAGFQPTVQSIDTWFVSRKCGMLFEARVGGGLLMMTSMDITSSLDSRPVARQMRKALIDYMQSDQFRPQTEVSAETVNELFTRKAGAVKTYTNDSPDELKPKIN